MMADVQQRAVASSASAVAGSSGRLQSLQHVYDDLVRSLNMDSPTASRAWAALVDVLSNSPVHPVETLVRRVALCVVRIH